jgi:hypothetical protein
MEKSTVSALIVAGAMVLGGVFRALVLHAARKRRSGANEEAHDEAGGDGA